MRLVGDTHIIKALKARIRYLESCLQVQGMKPLAILFAGRRKRGDVEKMLAESKRELRVWESSYEANGVAGGVTAK